jgi:protein-tyrosine-phosphatase
MAAAMMKDKVAKSAALRGKVNVYSCGTGAEDGDTASRMSIQTMEEYGIDLTRHRATYLLHSSIADMDLILCAETHHKEYIFRHFPTLREKGNVYTLKDYVKDETAPNIKDPYGYGEEVYRQCASEIERCLDKLMVVLRK